MVVLLEANTDTTIPSDRTFEKSSMLYSVNRRYLNFQEGLVFPLDNV